MLKPVVVLVALASITSVAFAADDIVPKRFKPNQFPQVVDLVESKMRPGGPYAATPEEAARVRGLLKEIEALLDGRQRLSDLNHLERAEVEKRRVAINELLSDNATESDPRTASKERRPRKVTDMLDSRPLPGGG